MCLLLLSGCSGCFWLDFDFARSDFHWSCLFLQQMILQQIIPLSLSLTFLISLWFILGESFLAFAAWLDSLERNTQNPLTHSVIWLTRQLVLSLVLDNNNLLLFSCFFSSDDERLKGEKRTFLSFNSSRKGVWRTKSRSDLHSPLSLFFSFLTSLHSWKGFMMMNRDREEKVCKKHEGVSNQGVVTKK